MANKRVNALGFEIRHNAVNDYGTPRALINLIFDKMEEKWGEEWIVQTTGRVLDVGTGDGRWIDEFLKRYTPEKAWGIDYVKHSDFPSHFNHRRFDLRDAFATPQVRTKKIGQPKEGLINLQQAIGTFNVVMGTPPFTGYLPDLAYRVARTLAKKPTAVNQANSFVILLTSGQFLEGKRRWNTLLSLPENRPEWVIPVVNHWHWDGENVNMKQHGFTKFRALCVWRGLADVKYPLMDWIVDDNA